MVSSFFGMIHLLDIFDFYPIFMQLLLVIKNCITKCLQCDFKCLAKPTQQISHFSLLCDENIFVSRGNKDMLWVCSSVPICLHSLDRKTFLECALRVDRWSISVKSHFLQGGRDGHWQRRLNDVSKALLQPPRVKKGKCQASTFFP